MPDLKGLIESLVKQLESSKPVIRQQEVFDKHIARQGGNNALEL